ncbi:hypothetical protein TEA_006380 [Camellia sinensis var. sinensis]|uniref:Uncharacterized protein n=1 Tax=Camellia sinensis var. sinensis TaxID=542762 RepID=A0A4S4E062_CAMSN|nr:hypothetical protein TEA_006380 [Camellia sinensis var. sinensis]
MPGNEVGDRLHNFFAQDNLPQGQHHSQVVDGSWPVPSNNPWAGSQRNIGLPSSNSKNYNLQQSDIERGHSSHSFSVQDGLNLTRSTLRPEFAKTQFQSQQPNLNGYMHGHQILQTRQNEANFLGVDTETDHHNMRSGGLSTYESQQMNVTENHNSSVRSESSESPVSFDFFGSQQQMSGQQTGMLHSLSRQQSGFSDIQLLQNQVMLRKMQELQRQQQIQQLEAVRQPNSVNQIPFITKQASGGHSPAIINGTPISPITEASNYPWVTEPTAGNTNWLQRTPAIQGSSNGFRFSPEQGQALSLMGVVPQQVDQTLYGAPFSNTRIASHQYSHIPIDKPPMQQVTMLSNSFPGNQYTGDPDQVNMQDESLLSRQGFQGENMFGHASRQGLNSGMDLEKLQQVNALQSNAHVQEFHESQELVDPSKTLQEKTLMQVSSSQNVVSLDPTEEKILFGDDNIWDAFGSSANMGVGGFNLSSGTGFSNGLPSLQSGSWSALMHSAVAETSSNDIGCQEEWSGLSFQNTEVLLRNSQPSTFENNTKQQTVLADNNLRISSMLSSGSVPPSDVNINNSYQGVPEFQQPGQKFSYEHADRLQMDSTHQSIQQSSEGGSQWLSRSPLQKPLAERSQMYGNAAHSLDAEMNAKSISGSWAHQQNDSSYVSGQPHNEPNGRDVSESLSPSGDAPSTVDGNVNKLQRMHSTDQKKMMYEASHGGYIWKADSGPNSTVGLEHVKSAMGSPQVNRMDDSLNNLAAIPSSSTARASLDTSQLLPNSHNLNYWKHADSSMNNKGSENSGRSQHHLNKGPQVLESSLNSSHKDAVKTHDLENCDRKENSSDSHRSNLSKHTTTGGLRENVWSDGSDSRNLPGGKQKSSGQAGRKTPAPRKFQYHPMGNLDEDVEPSYRMKQAPHSQVASQQIPRASYNHNEGYFGQSKFFGQFPKTSTEMEKGHSPDLQANKKGEDEVPSRGTHPGFAPNASAPFDRSSGIYAPNKAAQSSQNMLELLHKVDQSKEHGNSDGSFGHHQQNQSSVSQGFGLQLAPPSQRLPVQNRALASQSSAQTVGSFSSSHTSPEIRDTGHAQLGSAAQEQSLPSHETSQGEFKFNKIGIPGQTGIEASEYGMQGNFSSALTSGFPHSRGQLQNEQMIDASGKMTTNQPKNVSFNRHASHFQQTDDSTIRASGDRSQPTDANHSYEIASAAQILVGRAMPSSQPFIASGISQPGAFPKMVPNPWINVPGQQHLLGAQPHKFPPSIFQSSESNNNVVSTSSTPQDQEDQDEERGKGLSESGANSMDSEGFVRGEEQPAKESIGQLRSSGNTDSAEKVSASLGKETVVKNLSEASPSNSASTQRDIEAFGRSLKPNNSMHHNYSLLNQMRTMRSTEIDPSNRGLKRLKGADSGLGCQIGAKAGQPNEQNVMVGDSLVQRSAIPSGDSKMLSFSGPMENWERNVPSQLGNAPSQDVHALVWKDSENYTHSTASVRVENSQISPQMAPSWFNQFGTFKNGQMLTAYDARKNTTVKTVEQPFTLGKPYDSLNAHNSLEQLNAAADSNQVGNIRQRSIPSSVAIESFSSHLSRVQDFTDQRLVVARPKKRKSATSELLPWHKEVTQGSQSLLTIRVTEVDWAKAANRLIDKVEDEAEVIEDGLLMLRPKRRLILTTQLMQQLFHPPSAAVLSADASSNCEALDYLVARHTLGDACSLIPCSGSDLCVPLDDTNLLSDKHKASERIGDQHLSKVMEDFIGRARKLENDFMRLEKRASVLDLRIDCQDLEKFSVINRFAMFHGRGQNDGAEASSSSDAAANAQRLCPQRYVTALPVPRNLPDRFTCFGNCTDTIESYNMEMQVKNGLLDFKRN